MIGLVFACLLRRSSMFGSCLELGGLNLSFSLGDKGRDVEVNTEEVWEPLLGELFDIICVLVAKKGGSNVAIF